MPRKRTERAAAQIPIPPLYKYRSLADGSRQWTEDIVRNSRLWYSKASAFNDPFDCNLMVAGKGPGEWEVYFGEALERLGSSIRSALEKPAQHAGMEIPAPDAQHPKKAERKPEQARWQMDITDAKGRAQEPAEFFNSLQSRSMKKMYDVLDQSFGVLSLSSRPDDILMWSHYANHHDGVCLEFHTDAHPRAFPRLHPVRYATEYPYISPHFPDLLRMLQKKGGISRIVIDVTDALAEDLDDFSFASDQQRKIAVSLARWFYVKSSSWAYESEWRALMDRPGLVPFTKRALKRIIVGCMNTEANLEWAREIVHGRRPRIQLCKAVKKQREFGLEIVPVT